VRCGLIAAAALALAAAGPRASIGSATMAQDHSVTLRLRAEGPGRVIGDGLIVYRPGEPGYRDVLLHVGGLRRGETQPVPPWPSRSISPK
jgi:hypothetical protein